MPKDITDVPESIRDILEYMPPELRQGVLRNYETRYAPFLAMLAGWKGAVQAHHRLGEDAAIARLQDQFFPLGTWTFPAQTMAVPQTPLKDTRRIRFNEALYDSADRSWLATGEGLLQPVQLLNAVVSQEDNSIALTLEGECTGDSSLDAILASGILTFLPLSEAAFRVLSAAEWHVQTSNSQVRPIRWERYDGFMAFEREMASARMMQRHLDLWLPAFHPFSRKIVLLSLDKHEIDAEIAPSKMRSTPLAENQFRLVGMLPGPSRFERETLKAVQKLEAYFNPIPIIQAGVETSQHGAPFPKIGSEYALRMSGKSGIFAAVGYHGGALLPGSLFRVPSSDLEAVEEDVELRISHPGFRDSTLKIYYTEPEASITAGLPAPSFLKLEDIRFRAPFPALGGLTANSPENRAEWARIAWYHSLLRPALLAEGDVYEILEQRRAASGSLLRFKALTREIFNRNEEGGLHWRSYLWPSLLAREASFNADSSEQETFEGARSMGNGVPWDNPHTRASTKRKNSYVPIVQNICLEFERTPLAAAVPDFLLEEAANYLASVISQYFALSAFRVEGRVV